MHPHQQHLVNKLRARGWVNENGRVVWPSDEQSRKAMARELLGSELVNSIDYWSSLANDQLDDTFRAPWAKPTDVDSSQAQRRAIFKTLSPEQREAVRYLIGDSLKVLHQIRRRKPRTNRLDSGYAHDSRNGRERTR
jgi:hypothetical protein